MESKIQEVTAEELLLLSATNNDFYCQHWFPKTFRQVGAPFHPQMWDALETPHERHIGCEVFRGGAKTTVLRTFTSKRIALAQSRTILYTSETSTHAERSVRWIKNQVLYNKPWANFFKLELGKKKTDEWLEIYNGIDDVMISLVSLGITGQSRGIVLDDYRPDLIIVDDACNEENTATPEQRKKIDNLVFGAFDKSLAPPTEAQDAKIVLLQTSLNELDLINTCHKDPAWKTFKFSCFDEEEKSTWEERFPTEFLKKEKQNHIRMNRLPLWLREMECKIVAESTSDFRSGWLKDWPGGILPEGGVHFLYIDPVPPPSPREIAMGLKDKDWEVLTVVKYYRGDYFLCESARNKGHTPEWTLMKFWYLIDRWDVKLWEAEPVNYQRTLKWLIEKSMTDRGRFINVHAPLKTDMRKKRVKIIDTLQPVASQGHIYINKQQNPEFVEQYTSYPNVVHEDDLDSFVGALKLAMENGPLMDADYDEVYENEDGSYETQQLGHAP